MKTKTTYLLPIWIDIVTEKEPISVMKDINDEITATFEAIGNIIERRGDSINVQWSINQHVRI